MSSGGQPGTPPPAAPTAPTAPWASVAEGQTWTIGDRPWFDVAVPEGPERDAIKAKNYAHPGVLAKSYVEAERRLSSFDATKMVRIPDENAKPEDWQAFHKQLGRPDSTEGYKDVKWGDDADPRMVEFGKSIAFDLGLSPKLVEGVLATKWNEFAAKVNTEGAEAERVKTEQDMAALKAGWKGDFDANLAAGDRVVKALAKAGLAEADLAVVEQHIGVPAVVKLLATIGKLTGEGKFMDNPNQGGGGDLSAMTPEQAKAEITTKTGDAEFQKVYMDKNHPGNKDAVKRMEALFAKANNILTT